MLSINAPSTIWIQVAKQVTISSPRIRVVFVGLWVKVNVLAYGRSIQVAKRTVNHYVISGQPSSVFFGRGKLVF